MKKNIFLVKVLIVYFLLIPDGFAVTSSHFDEGRKLFNKKGQGYLIASHDIK